MKVLIINHCSTNKGDKAVLEFILQEMAANGVSQVTVSANETTCCHGVKLPERLQVKFVPWGWNIERCRKVGFFGRIIQRIRCKFYQRSYSVVRRSLLNGTCPKLLSYLCNSKFYDELRSADLVISTGGHHVTSILSPNAMSPQTFEMALALLADKPLYLWSQSIGPLDFTDEESRIFIRKILIRASGIYVRDKYSLVELEKLGITIENVRFTYESVFGFGGKLGYISKPSDRLPLVGISVYSVLARSVKEHTRYINALREVIDHITSVGYRVKFFPMQVQDEPGDDMPCIQSILNVVQEPELCSVYAGAASVLEHIKEVAKCRLFIGHKTHSVIIALVTGTPILAIAYHPKTTEFMTQIKMSENCIDDNSLEGKQLIGMFDRISLKIDTIGEKQLEESVRFGTVVRHEFSEMLRSKKFIAIPDAESRLY